MEGVVVAMGESNLFSLKQALRTKTGRTDKVSLGSHFSVAGFIFLWALGEHENKL